MKALILNSGMGTRMGDLVSQHPKCMTKLNNDQTIISRQLQLLNQMGISEVVITTGPFEDVLIRHCKSLNLPVNYTFVNNSMYSMTNYIYSIYLAREYLENDIVLMHGDLVFEQSVLHDVLNMKESCLAVSSTIPLPEKDFKAVIENGKITKVGIEYFENAVAAQPLYKLNKTDWMVWLREIVRFCDTNNVKCYAENAFNEVSDICNIYPLDIKNRLCREVDTPEDMELVSGMLSAAVSYI
ncbi:MAG TPA: NTP transferase domain-containing protein [Clostridiales bacterium]|nr:NTP transferase domain-containing protein [Clostridiales bacterium]